MHASLLLTCILSVVMVVCFTGIAYFTHSVTIADGAETKNYFTSLDDPNQILTEQGYTLGSDDVMQFTSFLENTGTITILRAFNVPVQVDGGTVNVPIAEGTVADVLTKGAITVSGDDLMNMAMTQQVTPGTEIVINRITYQDKTENRDIPFDTVQTSTAALKRGHSDIARQGEVGTLQVTSKQTLKDGVVIEENVLSETVIKEPVSAHVRVGTAMQTPVVKDATPDSLVLDEKGIPVSYSKVLSGKSAAYTAGANARTASGRKAAIGTVAVNPNVIPYGTKLYIVSSDHRYVYGYAVAADTGTALMDGRIVVDLYFGARSTGYAASCKWGIKNVDIYVLN